MPGQPITTTSPIRIPVQTVVQYAYSIPQSDAGWTTLYNIRWEGGTEDLGQQLGSATLVQDFGNRSAFQGPGPQTYIDDLQMDDGGMGGVLIRILAQSETGTTAINGVNYQAFWWGQVVNPSTVPGGQAEYVNGTSTLQCVSIASVLEQIDIDHGYVLSPSSGNPATPRSCPPFNNLPGGDMSSSTVSLNGQQVNVHDLTTLGTGTYWTAAAIVQLLLVGHTQPALPPDYVPAGFTWALSDPSSALDYVPPTLNLDGMSVMQALNELISEARGLTWYTTVTAAGVCTINVTSASPEAIQCPDGPIGPGYYFPAAVSTATVSIPGRTFLADVTVTEDWSQAYDVIEMRGARPWVCLTVDMQNQAYAALSGSGFGWSSGAEFSWASYPSGIPDVWRRFQINNDWQGSQYPSLVGDTAATNGLRNALATDSTNGLYGVGGLTGARSYNPNGIAPGGGYVAGVGPCAPAFMVKGERFLSAGVGFTGERVGPRQPPIVVVSSGGQTYWEDYSEQYSVEVQDYPLAVVIDDQFSGQFNQGYFNAGEAVLVSIGVREVEPLVVSWVSDPAGRINGSPRIKVIDMPQCELWTILAGTVTGINFDADTVDGEEQISSTLATLATDTVIRDDTYLLQSALALVQPWLSVPAMNATWTDRGILDISSGLRSGTLVTEFTRGDGALVINGLIRRSWSVTHVVEDGIETVYHSTQYNTRRLAPDFGVVVAQLNSYAGRVA